MTLFLSPSSDLAVQKAAEELREWGQSRQGLGVALIYGPVSAEDRLYHSKCPIEQRSVTALAEALEEIGARWRVLNPCEPDFIAELVGYDVALSNLHGPYGEDGRLQGLLDYLRVPYCGSGVRRRSRAKPLLVLWSSRAGAATSRYGPTAKLQADSTSSGAGHAPTWPATPCTVSWPSTGYPRHRAPPPVPAPNERCAS